MYTAGSKLLVGGTFVLVVLGTTAEVRGQEREGYRHLQITVDRGLFDEICGLLELDTLEQRMNAERLFRDYLEDLQRLDASTHEQMVRAGWHEVRTWERRRLEHLQQLNRATPQTDEASGLEGSRSSEASERPESAPWTSPSIQELDFECKLRRYEGRVSACQRLDRMVSDLQQEFSVPR